MSSHNIRFRGETRKILCEYPILSGAMTKRGIISTRTWLIWTCTIFTVSIVTVLWQTGLSKQCRPRSDAENLASDQSLYCLPLILLGTSTDSKMDDHSVAQLDEHLFFSTKTYSRLPLSRIPRDSLKHFEISVLRHISWESEENSKLNNHI